MIFLSKKIPRTLFSYYAKKNISNIPSVVYSLKSHVVLNAISLPSKSCFVKKTSNTTTDQVFVRKNQGTKKILKKQDYKQKNTLKKSRLYKRKIKGVLGKLYISSTKNNTILTLVDTKGNTKGWGCTGSLGFKNARKSTTYAAQAAAESMVKKARVLGYTHLRLSVKGLGRSKQSCLRTLSKSGLKIVSLEDKTATPYNGCRASKKRRV